MTIRQLTLGGQPATAEQISRSLTLDLLRDGVAPEKLGYMRNGVFYAPYVFGSETSPVAAYMATPKNGIAQSKA